MKSKWLGFTLVEMMITIAIFGVLLAIAIPSLQRFVIDSRMTAQANEFLTMLHYTRSEAVKRNTRVTMCKSSDGATCTGLGGWQQGWIVFVDAPAFGVRDGNDELLRVHGTLAGSSTLLGNDPVANYVSYISNGQSNLANGAMQGGTIQLCSGVAGIAGRDVVITTGPGRPRVQPGCP